MPISEASKRELRRRRQEQVGLAHDRIAEFTNWLIKGDYQHGSHRTTLRGPLLTDEEMKVWMEGKLVEMRDHLKRWQQPFDFEIS